MRFVLWTLLAMLLAVPAKSRATEPKTIDLAKKGPWVADYDVNRCRMIGHFGEGGDEITAIFTRRDMRDWFDLTLQGKRLAPLTKGGNAKIRLRFGTGGELEEAVGLTGNLDGVPMIMLPFRRLDGLRPTAESPIDTLPAITSAQEKQISDLTVAAKWHPFRLQLGSMGPVMAEMRRCIDKLVAYWGYDAAALASARRAVTPKGSIGSWITANDYPDKSAWSGKQGYWAARLDIDESGTVTACHVLDETRPAEFAALACKLLVKRAKFEPALDRSGNAIKSFYATGGMFFLPK